MNSSIDLYLKVQKMQPADKLSGQIARRDPGGGGINVARAISSLGGEALAIFPVGGPSGIFLQNLLEAEKVPCGTAEIEGINRENFTVFEEESGHEYRFVLPGPELSQTFTNCCAPLDKSRRFIASTYIHTLLYCSTTARLVFDNF